MNLTSKQSLIAIVVLAVICIFLGAQLFLGNKNYDDLKNKHGQLEKDKEQVVFDLEKMRFSYDTLQTENSMIIAEIAAQRDRVDGLLTKVKNGNWALGRAKKEAETLKTIMKGYIATIDSVNQLNNALTEENSAMRDRVEEVQDRNSLLDMLPGFITASHVTVIDLNSNFFISPLVFFYEVFHFLAAVHDSSFVFIRTIYRKKNNLFRCYSRWQNETIIIGMSHNEPSDQTS